MSNFWLSWYCPEEDYGKFELHSPWWVSGIDAENRSTICAAVQAENEEAAKQHIIDSYDEPKPTTIDWRFVSPQGLDWSPFCDRFQRREWMQWKDAKLEAQP